MAQRRGAKLEKGTLVDYASASRIMKLFEGDMKAIRAEYSRQRSIIRKRVERMAAAGETHNITFGKFGNVRNQLPTVRSLTDAQVLEMLQATAGQIASGYRTATLSGIKMSRIDWQKQAAHDAKAAGDTETAEKLTARDLSAAQWDRIGRLMGMVTKVTANLSVGSDEVYTSVIQEVVGGGYEPNLFKTAQTIFDILDIQEDKDDKLAMESVKEKYTAKGTVRVSWKKARQKRGQ